MNAFSLVFLFALLAGVLLQQWLIARQSRYIISHRDSVPAAFAERISLQQHHTAASYNLARLNLERWNLWLGAIVVLGWTIGGGLDWLAQQIEHLGWSPLWSGVALVLTSVLIGALIDLPLSLWRIFGIEQRFGFNRNTVPGVVKDLLLTGLLTLLLGTPLLAVVLWLMDSAGTLWWLWVWAVWIGFSLTLTWAYPALIAPLFNKFEPLTDLALRERLEHLLTRCGFHSDGMFVMDGSRRSAHGNAYFSGFGNHKRIVFFDTLLDGLDADEIEAVLAHELGHFKRKHIVKMLSVSALSALLGLALLGWLTSKTWFYAGLGISAPSNAVALMLFLFIVPVFGVFVSPLMARWSRRHEFEADDYAARQTDPRHLISGLVKMYRDNASTLTPDPLYSAFHHSHPPAPVRIANLSAKIAR